MEKHIHSQACPGAGCRGWTPPGTRGRVVARPRGILVAFDGACDPNPGGIATYGFVIRRAGSPPIKDRGELPQSRTWDATNNVAEYTGLIRALERLVEIGWTKEPIEVRGDSKLVLLQMRGRWRVHSPRLAPFHARGRDLVAKLGPIWYEWISRWSNKEADGLCHRAAREARKRRRVRVGGSPRDSSDPRIEVAPVVA